MTDELTELTLKINRRPEDDDEEVERITRQLRKELLNMDNVQKVDFVKKGTVEPGAKYIEAINLGELVVGVSGALIGPLIGLIQSWLEQRGHGEGTVTLKDERGEVEVPANPSEYQKRLIQDWMSRHREKK